MASIVIIADDGFRDEEVFYPYYRLKEAGHEVFVATPGRKRITGKFGVPFEADLDCDALKPEDFYGVIHPGGLNSPDKIRMREPVLEFTRALHRAGKLVAAICHGGWVPVSAGIMQGKRATGYRAIRDDLTHAGALYEDAEVVVDGNIVTSRKPEDLPAFTREILKLLN